jgi:prepilin-type N-terminal cleavage/methylation domain-containing protein
MGSNGFTATELLLTVAVVATVSGLALPMTRDAIESTRTSMAAAYVARRIGGARIDAAKRSASVGLKFDPDGRDYSFAMYVDGNRNGIRSADIVGGADARLTQREHLKDNFPGVEFGLMSGLPDVDGARDTAGGDGVRIGATRILAVGPDGTATSGTVYLHGRRAQYAVRVLGGTGRTRVFRYDTGARTWISR